MSKELLDRIYQAPYQNYIYSYPHKRSYREFKTPFELKKLWQAHPKRGITLYLHLPFCEHKCGYCNLFSTTNFTQHKLEQYLQQLLRELQSVKDFLALPEGEQPFTKVILGGGTPTVLEVNLLRKLFEAVQEILGLDFGKIFLAIETSPHTLSQAKLSLLEEYQFNRVSIGVQSFQASELKRLQRRQSLVEIEAALELLFSAQFKIRNLDLIYGIPAQTLDSWQESLQRVVQYQPEELYLYPLYLREKTSLYQEHSWQRNEILMLELYEFAKSFLSQNNYLQTSMRNFIRKDQAAKLAPAVGCQMNEMIGIGCGARSYCGQVHYSRRYAVAQGQIDQIIDDYLKETDFQIARYGRILDLDEQKRLYILKSILKITGFKLSDYQELFGTAPGEDYPELNLLIAEGFLRRDGEYITPTEQGLKYSDSIGELFVSELTRTRMQHFGED